jgi:S1-C subfamily serine protease
VNLLDILIILAVVAAAISGYRRGASMQLIEYLGLFAGLLAGALLAPRIASLAGSPTMRALLAVGALVGMAMLGGALGWLLGSRVWAAARRGPLGRVDAVGGSLVSVAAVLLVVWFLAFNLASGPVPFVSRAIRSSAIVSDLEAELPRPPSVLSQARAFLDRFGFPQVFAGLPPLPAGPVHLPGAHGVHAIVGDAAASTVRVEGLACRGEIEEGSGFVVAPHYVMTNAHVVAGVRLPTVEPPTGDRLPAIPVLFDPHEDVAILYVPGSTQPPLSFAAAALRRGTGGAVLGYPGGGPLAWGAAAVQRELDAVGRDIYGNGLVTRKVYELEAVVRPGNSGGPFVLASGKVGGVVFAASTTDGSVGYALAASGVTGDLAKARGDTTAVSTGRCIA